jgi:type II secretory pathway component GspD/PulD (secretin)
VDIWSNETLTKEEALDLLDTVLIQNNLAAIRNGKVLSIVNRDEAKTQNVPVVQEADPAKIPSTDRIVTQIIPVRYVEVAQLVKDLQPLLSVQTTITANEAGNSLVITDTQANIKKVAEVVRAIDMGAEDVGLVKVFHLEHADPTETADLLTNLFPDDSRTGGTQGSQFGGRFGGFGGFFGGGRGGFGGGGGFGNRGGGGGGGQGAGNNSQNQRLRKRNRVVAVADPRTASVVVTATRDLMDQIEGVIEVLDSDNSSQQGIAVFRMQNAQPQEAMQVLQDIFNKNNQQNNRNNNTANQTSPLTGRSNTQNQQNNNGTSRSTMTGGNQRGGAGIGGGGGFGP